MWYERPLKWIGISLFTGAFALVGIPTVAGISTLVGSPPVLAAEKEGNWRRGRIYYRMVCTTCHKEMAGKIISPVDKTIAEWTAYVDTGKHDATGKSNDSLKHYASTAYRESIKDTNKAAAKFIKLPEEELFADLRAWVVRGAKDSDTPARCK